MNKPKEIEHPKSGKYVKDAVYGASDGIVSTFAIVAGVSGAALGPGIVLILGFAGLFADAISMAAGNFLGSKSLSNFHKTERRREVWEINNVPEEEKKEIKEIYSKMGFKGKLLNDVVNHITKNKKVWADEMMLHELGIVEDDLVAKKSAIITFFSFLGAGIIPLISFVISQFFGVGSPFVWAIGLTAFALFIVGNLKSQITGENSIKDGFQMLFIGGFAALAAYYIGFFVSQIV